MVLMVMLHSLLEYPLWYSYFLLPTAFAFGLCLAEPAGPGASSPALPMGRTARTRPLVIASMVMTFGGMFALYDYLRVVVIFAPPAGAAPLADRIADGRRSVLFSHHADYAAATTAEHPSDAMWAFTGAPHYLLDARLMQAWAVALYESGDTDRARHVAARLKEFKSDQSEAFFAVCDEAGHPRRSGRSNANRRCAPIPISTSGSRFGGPVSRLAAVLLEHPDLADHHSAIDRLAHVVDGQQPDLHRGQRFHLDPGAPGVSTCAVQRMRRPASSTENRPRRA